MPHGSPRQRVKLVGVFNDAALIVQRPQAGAYVGRHGYLDGIGCINST
jgi:hypothetical protein